MVRLLCKIAFLIVVVMLLLPTPASARRHHRRPIISPRIAAPPIIPVIDTTLKARLRAILADGAVQGNRPTVFAKIGDSITESGSFLGDIGCGAETLGAHSELADGINYFRATTFPADYTNVWCTSANSFTRGSAGAATGWSADQILGAPDNMHTECQNGESALACELRVLKPALALIMVGTNDLERFNDPERYRVDLTHIVTTTVGAGVIPVLSTIPPRLDNTDLGVRVAAYNNVVIEVAQAQQIPLWNFWLATQAASMVNQGISDDGVHPNLFGGCVNGQCLAADFTDDGLRYGYNQRNFTALQVLVKIKTVVVDDGAADDANNPTPATTTPAILATPSPTTSTNTPQPDSGASGVYLPLIIQAQGQAGSTAVPTLTPTPVTPEPTATATSTTTCTALPGGPITYVALGDSLTQGDGDEAELGGYPGRLLSRLQTLRNDSTLTNLGHSGWTSENLINGLDSEPSELSQAVALLNQAKAAGQPSLATVWIGSNDLWYLYEYGNPTPVDETQDLQHFTTNLDTILSQLHATGAAVFLALLDDQSKRPVATAHQAFPGTSDAELALMAQQVIRYNDAINAKATQFGATTVDFYHTTIFTDPATLAGDGNHPNAAGYDLISQMWFTALQPRLGNCNATAGQ